jgi:hypothetical protein
MCCGKNRTGMSQTRVASPANRAVQASSAVATRQLSSVAYFEYTGKTALTVVGPVSGMRYRFAAPGSRVAVDLRDRKHFAAVPNLVQVRSL